MKIGFVLDDRIDVSDGVQQYVRTVGAWLEQQGHVVHFLVGQAPDNSSVNTHQLSRTVGLRFNKNRVRLPLPANISDIKAVLIKESFDVLHVQMPFAPWLAGKVIAAAPDSTAIVGTFHVVLNSPIVAQFARALRPVYAKYAKRIDEVCAVSEPAHALMQRSLGLHGTIIPNTVNLETYKIAKHHKRYVDDKLNILFLGRLVERKGARYAIEAFARVSDPKKHRLIIIGDGPLRAKLEKRIKAIGLAGLVVFEGYVNEKEKPSFLAAADIALFPATGGESFGIVLLEAMAARAGVVLAGDNPGYKAVLGSIPEALIDPKNIVEFSERLKNIINDTPLRRQLHRQQQTLIQQYDVHTVGPQILRMYQAALLAHKKVA